MTNTPISAHLEMCDFVPWYTAFGCLLARKRRSMKTNSSPQPMKRTSISQCTQRDRSSSDWPWAE
jgi:hypothetical protein